MLNLHYDLFTLKLVTTNLSMLADLKSCIWFNFPIYNFLEELKTQM